MIDVYPVVHLVLLPVRLLPCSRSWFIPSCGSILLPFRIAGIAVHGVLAFLRGFFFLPALLLRGPRAI